IPDLLQRRFHVTPPSVQTLNDESGWPDAASRVPSSCMRGAVAAGHPLTADAGARVLAAGGNAVDACVAAAFVSWVCESPLTGPGRPREAGERFAIPDLASTLDLLAEEGAAALYRGTLARAIVEHVQAGGGTLSAEDLESYRMIRRRPVTVSYRGHEFRSNPPPSSGGILIALGLRALGDAAPTP